VFFPRAPPIINKDITKSRLRHAMLWQSDYTHASLFLINKKSLTMNQAYRGLFRSKVVFKVDLIYIFVSISSSRKRCQKGKPRGRESQPETSTQCRLSQELLSHVWILYKAALRWTLSLGSSPPNIVKGFFRWSDCYLLWFLMTPAQASPKKLRDHLFKFAIKTSYQ